VIAYSIIYINNSHFFEDFGGALGVLAFISLLTTMGIADLLLRFTTIKKAPYLSEKSF
jgi:hypothetical protein